MERNMGNEIIHMRPSRSLEWTCRCKECQKLIKASGFFIELSQAWDATPDDKFYLCKRDATKAYPNYFKKGKK